MDMRKILLAVMLGLIAHSLIGYQAFPYGDDFAYGPLAEHSIDPTLFRHDDQLRLFENHAHVYEWVYRLGKVGLGVEPTFHIAVWLQAAAASVAILAILYALGVPAIGLLGVLGLGVLVNLDGLGRGDFGGLISPFFHHQNVALILVLGAVAAGLLRKSWLAGIFLGLAVYAQPMTALHGAAVLGLGSLIRDPADVMKMAIAAIVVALPVAVPIVGTVLNGPETNVAFDVVRDAYRYRAPAHYDPPWFDVGITTLYLLAGCAGAALLMRQAPYLGRFSAGVMVGFGLLHLVTVVVYKGGIAEWIGFFILDANRSTPALFVIGPALAIAGIWSRRQDRLVWIAALPLLAIMAFNTTLVGLIVVGLGLLLAALKNVPNVQTLYLVGSAAALVLLFPAPRQLPLLPEPTHQMFEHIRDNTTVDALFVIPVNLFTFRHFTQRSAYVDFKLFSVAQPDQAALTRARLDQVASPAPQDRNVQGWLAAQLWDQEQQRTATCATMAQTLAVTGADYYLRRVSPDEAAPNCPTLARPILTATMALYGSEE